MPHLTAHFRRFLNTLGGSRRRRLVWGGDMPREIVRKIVNRIAHFVTPTTRNFVHNFPTPLESTHATPKSPRGKKAFGPLIVGESANPCDVGFNGCVAWGAVNILQWFARAPADVAMWTAVVGGAHGVGDEVDRAAEVSVECFHGDVQCADPAGFGGGAVVVEKWGVGEREGEVGAVHDAVRLGVPVVRGECVVGEEGGGEVAELGRDWVVGGALPAELEGVAVALAGQGPDGCGDGVLVAADVFEVVEDGVELRAWLPFEDARDGFGQGCDVDSGDGVGGVEDLASIVEAGAPFAAGDGGAVGQRDFGEFGLSAEVRHGEAVEARGGAPNDGGFAVFAAVDESSCDAAGVGV